MGIAFTILGTMLVAISTWPLPSLLIRLVLTLVSAYGIACAAYWLPFFFSANDQASSWQWIVINTYFKVGVVFGLFVQGVIQVVKSMSTRSRSD